MTENERVELYNDLCDFKSDLQMICYPPQTRQIDILSRAIAYVKGTSAKWEKSNDSKDFFNDERFAFFAPSTCSSCHFAHGRSDFRRCPNCGARMQK